MQGYQVILGCSLIVVFLFVVCLPSATSDDVIIQKRVYPAEVERLLDPKRKRPFCNAFTGCGKKRADESMATLVDLNAEPAVEELSRQIMSEAKLWEAIQEARLELLRRRQQQQLQPSQLAAERPMSFATGYRKKRETGRGAAAEDKMKFGKSKPWSR